MGTDDLFHKRKKRKIRSLRRKQAMKDSCDVILIVCEWCIPFWNICGI